MVDERGLIFVTDGWYKNYGLLICSCPCVTTGMQELEFLKRKF